MHVLNVIGNPCHEPAYRITDKKSNGEALDMRKEFYPQVMHYHLACIFHNHNLKKIKGKVCDYNRQKDSGNNTDTFKIVFAQYNNIFFFQFRQVFKRYGRDFFVNF